MRRKIKILVSCIATISLTIYLLFQLTNLMERKSSEAKYSDFFTQEEDFDVLFLGTSHVINGVFPMELWNKYGIISYNFGGHDNKMATMYWVLENALDYTNPKVVVIDCARLAGNYKCSEIFSLVHQSLDAFPLTITKVRAIWDLLDDPALNGAIANGEVYEGDEQRTKIGLLWDYSVYHSRWTEIEQADFEPCLTYEKGAESIIGVTRGKLDKISSEQKMGFGTTGDIYLRRMIEDCQDRGIEVLLTYLPFPASEGEQMEANYAYDIAAEYGVDYINFLDMDVINYQTDLYDEASHLNPSGARKITYYLGEYLISNYEVSDHRKEEEYFYWYEDYDEYIALKDKNIIGCNKIEDYLMLLSRDNVDAVIEVRNKDIFKNAWVIDLLDNLGVNINEVNENTDFVIIKNGGEESMIINGGHNHSVENTGENVGTVISVIRDGAEVDNVKFTYAVDSESAEFVNCSANR